MASTDDSVYYSKKSIFILFEPVPGPCGRTQLLRGRAGQNSTARDTPRRCCFFDYASTLEAVKGRCDQPTKLGTKNRMKASVWG